MIGKQKSPLTLGRYTFPLGLVLAPMAGFTDRAMRQIAHRHGAELTVTEMISAKAVTFGDKKTALLTKIEKEDGPTLLQLFGSEPDTVARSIELLTPALEAAPPVGFDINMGCPVPKIFKNGEGSALMKNPRLIEKIVRAAREATDLPITVKMRLGIDTEHQNVIECALAAEQGGASMVAVHGRTRTQMYSGKADYESIKNVKNYLHIPLIANGDVTSGESALAILEATEADGLMVGRAAIGNPFLFREIRAALLDEPYTPPTLDDRIGCALEELAIAISDKGEELAVRESRGKIALYLHGLRGAAALRAKVHRACTYKDILLAFENVRREYIQ